MDIVIKELASQSGGKVGLDDHHRIASPLGRSRLIALAVIVLCLAAMFAIVRFGPNSELVGLL
jgi:hypothetical protein